MKKLVISAIALVALAFNTQAQSLQFKNADESPCIRIYNGYTGTLSVVIQGTGGTQYVATVDGLATTIAAKTNVSLLASAIAAVTNTSGSASLIVDATVSLAADSTVANVLAGTYTALAGRWVTIPWDTSQCKFYDVAVSQGTWFDANGRALIDPSRPANNPINVSNIYGQPTGTGDLTLGVYVAGSLVWQKIVTSPVYVLGAGGTNVAVDVVTLNESVNIPVGGQQSLLIRASRATTATTGNIGAIFVPKPNLFP